MQNLLGVFVEQIILVINMLKFYQRNPGNFLFVTQNLEVHTDLVYKFEEEALVLESVEILD